MNWDITTDFTTTGKIIQDTLKQFYVHKYNILIQITKTQPRGNNLSCFVITKEIEFVILKVQ